MKVTIQYQHNDGKVYQVEEYKLDTAYRKVKDAAGNPIHTAAGRLTVNQFLDRCTKHGIQVMVDSNGSINSNLGNFSTTTVQDFQSNDSQDVEETGVTIQTNPDSATGTIEGGQETEALQGGEGQDSSESESNEGSESEQEAEQESGSSNEGSESEQEAEQESGSSNEGSESEQNEQSSESQDTEQKPEQQKPEQQKPEQQKPEQRPKEKPPRRFNGDAKHKQYDDVMDEIRLRNHVLLTGDAGGGKSHTMQQIGKALGRPYVTINFTKQTTESKLMGLYNPINHEFIETNLYKAFKYGHVLGLEEVDNADANILTGLNELLANKETTFPNGERVQQHENFVVIGAMNTTGNGATQNYTRNKQDKAFMDRFAVIEWKNDDQLEMYICQHKIWTDDHWDTDYWMEADRWVNYVQALRKRSAQLKMNEKGVQITPRAAIMGAKRLRLKGESAQNLKKCIDHYIRKGMKDDQWQAISQGIEY